MCLWYTVFIQCSRIFFPFFSPFLVCWYVIILNFCPYILENCRFQKVIYDILLPIFSSLFYSNSDYILHILGCQIACAMTSNILSTEHVDRSRPLKAWARPAQVAWLFFRPCLNGWPRGSAAWARPASSLSMNWTSNGCRAQPKIHQLLAWRNYTIVWDFFLATWACGPTTHQ